jgi:antirestriction protein ArdC
MRVEEIITDRIVKLLETGIVPWHKPWRQSRDWRRRHAAQCR